ncbi:LysR substrate-binding domain-containing protein [Burkholderia sp. MR1-5-21]
MAQSRIPRIELLRSFKAVVESRNFSAAAVNLNVTQSAVSHRIKRLEDELGMDLFRRSSHDVVLTEAGRLLFRDIDTALSVLEAVFRETGRYKEAESLEIEVDPAFATRWLSARLRKFTESHPATRLHIHLSDKRVEFAEKTELAVKWGRGLWNGYRCEQLLSLTFTPMCSADYLRSHKLHDVADLLDCTLLHDRNHDTWKYWARRAGLEEARVSSGHVIADTVLLEQTAIEGHGIALHALELAEVAIARGDLVRPFPEIAIRSQESYYVVTRSDARLGPMAKSFVSWLHSEAGSSLGDMTVTKALGN